MDKKITFELADPKLTVKAVVNGDYVRSFENEKPPLTATQEEWERFLLPTGYFREVKAQSRRTSEVTNA